MPTSDLDVISSYFWNW